jgi:hypothetical protein
MKGGLGVICMIMIFKSACRHIEEEEEEEEEEDSS